jgi:hypothetical protein
LQVAIRLQIGLRSTPALVQALLAAAAHALPTLDLDLIRDAHNGRLGGQVGRLQLLVLIGVIRHLAASPRRGPLAKASIAPLRGLATHLAGLRFAEDGDGTTAEIFPERVLRVGRRWPWGCPGPMGMGTGAIHGTASDGGRAIPLNDVTAGRWIYSRA